MTLAVCTTSRYTAECVHCRVTLARGWMVRLCQRLKGRR